jgi:hypothetical protein
VSENKNWENDFVLSTEHIVVHPVLGVKMQLNPTNPMSPRMNFQWHYFINAKEQGERDVPNVLNIGCADDPVGFGDAAFHYDIDDWSKYHKHFKQGDASDLPFADRSFDTVIMGDIHEHAMDPQAITREGARVADRILCMTIFEEWELPGPGQWVQEGQDNSDEESRRLGYKDRMDYQDKVYPDKVTVDDVITPHLIHINQFTDQDIYDMTKMVEGMGFTTREFLKIPEEVQDGHEWSNWLVVMERIGAE